MVVMNRGARNKLADSGISIDSESDRGWRVAIIFQSFHQGDDDSLPLPCRFINGNGCCYGDWPEKHSSLGNQTRPSPKGRRRGDGTSVRPAWCAILRGNDSCNRIAVDKRALDTPHAGRPAAKIYL
jgi:hypothetical protein